MRLNHLSFTVLAATAAPGGALFGVRLVFVEPLLENCPENAQGHQAK